MILVVNRSSIGEKKETVAMCEEVRQVLAEVNASSEKLFDSNFP